MAPRLSELKCRCGRNALEWVSFTHKNPGRRFVRCSNRLRSCGYWEWIDDPISPLVRSAMDANVKKAEKKFKILGFALVLVLGLLFIVLMGGKGEECKCSCNFGMYEIAAAQN